MALKAHLDQAANDLSNRRHQRRSLYLETSGILRDGHEANVTIHNLSAAGLLLQTDLALEVGEKLLIDLPEAGDVPAAIVWCSDDLYGCAFDQLLSEAALAAAELLGNIALGRDPAVAASPVITPPASGSGADHSAGRAEPLGARLNRLRRERGMTLSDVASALGVSKPTVWAWEKGKARPLPERIEAIANALDVAPEDLRVTGGLGQSSALVEECRLRIATAYGTEPQNVRIMIEM
ncbi:MAG: helix-turn-helix domain-containing protein [Pseudomonadota bacterium]